MGDRYYPPRGYGRPSNRDERNDRHHRDARYAYDDRYGRYDRNDRYERPRSRSPPRNNQGRFADRNDDYTRNNEYAFRGAADRGGHTYRPQPLPQSDFTFQATGPPAPEFPPQERRRSPALRPHPASARAKTSRREREQAKRGPTFQRGEKVTGPGARGWFRKPPPHQRDILNRQAGDSTPEQLHGMNEEGQSRFNAYFSSTDDQGSEDGEIEEDMANGEGPRKRVRTDVTDPVEQTAPKWSNPEYFTALPPPESSLGPKKDIVQVIRKAKVEAAARQDTASNAVKQNADFISFSMDDDTLEVNDEDSGNVPPGNVPTGPKLGKHSVTKPKDEPAPKKRPFKQFVRPRSPQLNFSLRRPDKVKDSVGPPTQPPPNIDQLMSMADRMHVSGKRDAKPHSIQEYTPDPWLLSDPTQWSNPEPLLPSEAIPDQPREPKGKKRKAAKISKGLGDVVVEWQSNETNSTPWCTIDHSRTANVGLRLHKEIADFHDFVRPHDYEEAARRDLVRRVQRSVQSSGPNARNVEIRSFGSFASGVYLPTADMDLVAVSPIYLQKDRKSFCQSNSQLYKLGHWLERDNVALHGSLTVIAKAKVPIIKFTDKETGIKVDISVENDTGLIALQTFAQWKEKYPAMSIIVVLIKQMLAMRNLNEVFHGGLGGFSIICMVVSMMQHMPEIQSGNMDPSLHYGDLLLNFLDLYGNKFNLQSTGIIMEPPRYFDKIGNPHKKQNDNGLTIVDPNNPHNDISGGSRKIEVVFECFRTACSEIQRRLAEIRSGKNVEESILGCVLGGNYTSFIKQRNRLSLLHSGRPMSPIPVVELDDSDEVEEVDAPQPKPHKKKDRKARAAKKSGGGKGPAKSSAAAPQASAAVLQRSQPNRIRHPLPQPQPGQIQHPIPQRPPPRNGSYEAQPTRKR